MGFFNFFKKKQPEPIKRPVVAVRTFNAATVDRLTNSWKTNSQSLDWELRGQLLILRARSRDLTQNNDYARKFLQMCKTHVVGPSGFSLQLNVNETDANGNVIMDGLANDSIEKSFWDWARVGNCDVTGKLSLFDICNLYVTTLARDGEVLIRKVYGKNGGKYGLQLQVFDVDRLEIRLNETLDNGNIIKMGVEINPYGKPVAYHIRTRHPGDSTLYGYVSSDITFERIPANEIYHHFIPERPEQTRGLPWMHSAMVRMQNLGGYEEAAVIAARVGAAKMGFYTTPDGDGSLPSTGTDSSGNLLQDSEAGAFEVLPAGYDFKTYDPDYPHQQFPEFVKACLRGIASGLGVAYNTLSNDLEGVNFSSIRTGVLEERDNWMVIQNWMIEQFLDPLFEEWLKMSLLNKMILLPNGSPLPLAKFDKFNQKTWQGRRWQWVDPVADTQANVLAVNNGFKSRHDVCAEQGKDFDDVVRKLAEEEEEIEAADIQLAPPPGVVQMPENQENENTDKKPTKSLKKKGFRK